MKRATCIFWLLLINFFSAASTYDVFEENGKVGLRNEQGKILIPAKYEALGWSNGKFNVVSNVIGFKEGGLWGLISLENRVLAKAAYEDLIPSDGPIVVARKKSSVSLRFVSGCLNVAGKEIIPFEYDGITISNQHAIVFTKIGNQYKYGLIDLQNKALIPQQYKSVRPIGKSRFAVENFDGKFALFSDAGKAVTPFAIDSISSVNRSYTIFYQGRQQGLLDQDGQIKLAPLYREIRIDEHGSVFTRQLDEWQFLDGQNKLLQKKQADNILPIGKNLLVTSSSGLIQLTDYQLNPMYTTSFSTLGTFIRKKAIFSIDRKYGIARLDGSIIVAARYDQLLPDQQFYISILRQGSKQNCFVLDSLGNAIHTKPYDQIGPFTGRIFPVKSRNFWGGINASGKEIVACTYDSILQQLNDLIVVKFKGQYGVINLHEEWKVTPRENKIELVNDTRFIEISPKTTYLKALDGSTVYFTDNKVTYGDNYLLDHLASGAIWQVDMDGVIINRKLQPDGLIDRIYPESEGLRGIRKNGQYGFIDSQGRLRVANRYDNIQAFSEGLAAVRILGKWGFISHEDKIAVQPVYDEVLPFSGGFSLVKQKGMQGLIDKSGKLVLPPRYESIQVLTHGNIVIKSGGLYGLSDHDGRVLINPKYNSLIDLNNSYVIVGRDGKYGVITLQGISTIPLIYDGISFDAFNGFFLSLKKSNWVKAF